MVHVSVASDDLRVTFEEHERDWSRRSSALLTIVLKAEQDGLVFKVRTGDLAEATLAVLSHLGRIGAPVDLDPSVVTLQEQLASARLEFEEARTAGRLGGEVPALGEFVRKLTVRQLETVRDLLKVTHSANFSVPGAGKTTMTLALFSALRELGHVDRIVVVSPRAAFQAWEDEFEACFGRRPVAARLVGAPDVRNRAYLESAQFELFLTTYQTATNDRTRLAGICRRHPVLLVLDESHYVKRLDEGVWSSAMLEIAPMAKRRTVLSGTPMPQGFEDLWTQFTFLWPGREVLGDKRTFRRLCEQADGEAIRRLVRPFFRRITKADLALPVLHMERKVVPLAPEQSRLYTAIQQRMVEDLSLAPEDQDALREWRRARIMRLLQVASNPELLSTADPEGLVGSEESSLVELARKYAELEVPAKLRAGQELVAQLVRDGKKVVVWTSFVRNIEVFSKLIAGYAPIFQVFGAVPRDASEDVEFNREQQLREFKSTDGPAVLLANPAACGESVSLHQACRDAIYLDRTFDAARFAQSKDRVHRLGLPPDAQVNCYVLVAADTIDEVVDRRLEEKLERMERLFEEELPQGGLDEVPGVAEEDADFLALLRAVTEA
jgi:SNF2 family DNA or RNA helicase